MRFSYSNILLEKSTFTLLAFIFFLGVGYFLAGEPPALASAVEPARRTPGLVRAGAAAAGWPLPSRLCSGSPALSAGGPARSTHTARQQLLLQHCHYLANLHGGIKALVLGEMTPAVPSRSAFSLSCCSSSGAPLCMPLRTGTRDKSVFILQITLTI